MDATVFESPALLLLVELEHAGFQLRLSSGDRIQVEPGSKLTDAQRRFLTDYKVAIVMLLRCCDDGVVDRRDAFRAQLEVTAPQMTPAFLFRPDVPYVAGRCFSCGEVNGRATFGRCWRCSLAWRLACRLPIPADLAAVIDSARKVA